MSNNPKSKDDALEALDFIVNVLKEHEKELDKLINDLADVTDKMGNPGELSNKVEKVEEKINVLQKEVTNLISYISTEAPKGTPAVQVKDQSSTVIIPPSAMEMGRSVILRCNQWEDFQNLAFQAHTLSFSFKEDQKVFQADALKANKIITYSGALPKFTLILKSWLSKSLDVHEKDVLEGGLAIS